MIFQLTLILDSYTDIVAGIPSKRQIEGKVPAGNTSVIRGLTWHNRLPLNNHFEGLFDFGSENERP
jgi:hypothetical protein